MLRRNREISNGADLIDSRDVIERIDSLQSDRDLAESVEIWEAENEDDAAELKALQALQESAEGVPDWQHGATLIRDSYFETYAQELAEDIGAIGRDLPWPACHIDWEAAADALKADYNCVDFDGVEYWVRS